MMNRRIAAALGTLILAAMLGGCQLAVPDDAVEGASKDVLCGMLVTLEPLDTGMEETLEIPADWNGNMEDIVFPEGRIYATRTVRGSSADYKFDGVKGYRLFAAKVQIEKFEPYWATYSDNEIQNVGTKYMSGGSQEAPTDTVQVTGTILFNVSKPVRVYANPVYQTTKGEIYAVQGQGLWMDELQAAGNSGSTKLSETTTETVGDSTSSRTMEVEIKIEGANPNKRIVLKQMNAQDQAVGRTEITPDNIPETIQLQAATAYMLLEEYGVDYEGKAVVKRTLVDADEEWFNARFPGDEGLILTHTVMFVPAGQHYEG